MITHNYVNMGAFVRVSKVISILLFVHLAVASDRPCRHKYFNKNKTASVCVCTSQYCDEITRHPPQNNSFVVYTSSEGGDRLKKEMFWLQKYVEPIQTQCKFEQICNPVLDLDPTVLYQTIEGFGGAVTDAAAKNWDSLKTYHLRKHLINSYFGPTGNEYNMIRLPIGGTDFSERPYTLNDDNPGDVNMTRFSLAREDTRYKIPMIKECLKVATSDIHIVGSAWTAPVWMKDNGNIIAGNLKPEYIDAYTNYHLKFLEKYKEAGIKMWALTTTNEPIAGSIDLGHINSMGWHIHLMGKWISESFGPALRNSVFNDTKILVADDQRNLIATLVDNLFSMTDARKYVDGVALHYYMDTVTPIEIVKNSLKDYPELFVINTEACTGVQSPNRNVDLGSWDRADAYTRDIIEDLNGNFVGWIDWNLALDERGGPNWAKNFVDSPIIIANDGFEFYKQPMFYALAHFSKFIPRGSRRVNTSNLCSKSVNNVSFLTPRNTIVTVLRNEGEPVVVNVKLCDQVASVQMEKNSFKTLEFLYNAC